MSECLSRLKSKVPFWMLLEAWHEGGQIISMLQSAGRKAAACTVELSDQRMLWSSSILQVCLGLHGKVRPAYVCCSQALPPTTIDMLHLDLWCCCDLWQISWVSWSPMLMQLTTLTVLLPVLPFSGRAAWEQTNNIRQLTKSEGNFEKTLAWPIGPFRTV